MFKFAVWKLSPVGQRSLYRGLGTSVHVKPYLPLPPQMGSQPPASLLSQDWPILPLPAALPAPFPPPSPSGAWAWGGLPPVPQSISGESMTTAVPALGWQHHGDFSGQPGRSEFLLTLTQVPSAPWCRDCHVWCHLSTTGWDGRPVGKGDANSLSCSPRTRAANGQCTHTPGCGVGSWVPVKVCTLPTPMALSSKQKVLSS